MPKEFRKLGLDDYVPVAERISLFYNRFPKGRIVARLVERTRDAIIVQASVYRSDAETQPSATGWAAERPGDGDINTVACLENAETSAIGRALANLGFSATRQLPLRDAPLERSQSTRPNEPAPRIDSLGVRTIRGHPPSTPLRRASLVARDFIALLDDARREGMRPARVAAWRARVEAGVCDDSTLERLEPALRRWVCSARDQHTTA